MKSNKQVVISGEIKISEQSTSSSARSTSGKYVLKNETFIINKDRVLEDVYVSINSKLRGRINPSLNQSISSEEDNFVTS